ncbi:MAG: response regulator [Pirellulaceae bacterium]|nr:response regulator [Pirellulaceae bacterium]
MRRVLLVGHCAADTASLQRILGTHFSVRVDSAATLGETLAIARQTPVDLVLVNRILDQDGSLGLDVIREWVSTSELAATPVMLISNFESAQQEAIAAGARPGFGKQRLHAPETLELLRLFLESPSSRTDSRSAE